MPNHLRFFNLLPLCVPTSWRNHCRGLAGSISITGRKDRFDCCAMELKPDSRIRSRRDPGRCICLCQGLWPDNPGIWCSDFTEVALLHRFHVEAIYNGGGRSTRSAEEEPNRGLSFVTVSFPPLHPSFLETAKRGHDASNETRPRPLPRLRNSNPRTLPLGAGLRPRRLRRRFTPDAATTATAKAAKSVCLSWSRGAASVLL
jgi:hypothetical protein